MMLKQLKHREFTILIIFTILILVGSSNNSINAKYLKDYDQTGTPTGIVSIVSHNDTITNGRFSSPVEIQTNSFQPNWVETLPLASPSARQHSAMAYDSINSKTVLFGGFDGSILNDTWVYDFGSNTWENMNPSISPDAQQGHSMVFDESIQKVVLFGSGGQTWTYDYSINNWEQQTPQVSPAGRQYQSMIYDTKRQKIMMFGGTSGTFETWEMDSTTFNWTNLGPVTPIPRLFAFAASYDQANDKIIVFGGQNVTTQALNRGDTFAYDYTTNRWEQLFQSQQPSDRRFYGKPMGYNPVAKKSVFFGGINDSGILNETWAFDYPTNSWELIETTNTPSPRWIHTIVFNSNVNRFIMFGGNSGGFTDETFILSAFDSDPPIVIGSGNKSIELNSINSAVSWQLFDQSGGIYNITLDGQLVDQGSFVDGQIISLVPFGLGLGNYSLKMTATDLEGNSASGTILLHVVEVEPPVIVGPDDMEIEFFDFNKSIAWILKDLTPSNYNVTQNGTLIDEGVWENGDTIVVNLDPLPLGTYIFEITVNDVYDNVASDTVVVKIFDGNVPFISNPDDIFSTEGTTGNKIVWEVDDDNPTLYILERNGEIIGNDTYLNVFFIEVNLDGYTFGFYNFTLTLYDEDGHSSFDYVEVQIFPINEGAGNTVAPRRGGGGGAVRDFIQNVDPQTAAGTGAFVAVFGGAFYILRKRG